MKKTLYIFIFVLISFSKGFAQNIDSLKLELKNAKYDTTKINILIELSEICEIEDISLYAEPCVKLCEKAISLKKVSKNFYIAHLAVAYNNIGFQASGEGQIIRALNYYHKSLKLDEGIKNKEGIATSLNNIGLIYDNQGDIPKALDYYHKSLKLRVEVKDLEGIATSLINIGYIYHTQGDLPKALDNYQIGLRLYEKIGDKSGVATSLNNIATIYSNQGDETKALVYYQKCLQLNEDNKDKQGIALSLNNIGGIYKTQAERNEDLEHRDEILTKALDFYLRSFQLSDKINDKMGITLSLNNIADVMLKQGKNRQALDYAVRSLHFARELGYPYDIKNAANTLKNIYKIQNKHKNAFEMYELEILMRDSITNEATKKASIQKQFQYEYEKKAAADSVVFAKENEIKEVEIARQKAEIKVKQNQQLALYGGLLLVLVFAGFMFNRFKVTQKQKMVIEQQKTTFEKAHVFLEEKNSEIIASIRYAKRIQDALMTSQKYMERNIERLKSTNKN